MSDDEPNQLNIHHPHDKGYRQILTNKKSFLQLIKSFIKENWVNDINEDDLILVNKSYITKEFTEKEADIVYKLKTRQTEIIFYILLELQSTVDYLMPFRLLQYMVEIWREVYNNTPSEKRERKDFRLPPVIPAVLYNGKDNWTVGLNFKEMLGGYQNFEQHLLDFRYILFDVNRYSEKELYQMANLVASVFLLDQTISHKELIRRFKKLARVLKRLTPEEFRQFVTWLINVLKPKFPSYMQKELDDVLCKNSPLEVDIMIMNLEITLDEMQKKARDEGKEENKKEVAKAALKEGATIEFISKITGLTKEEIQKLKDEMN